MGLRRQVRVGKLPVDMYPKTRCNVGYLDTDKDTDMPQQMTKKATILFPPALYQELEDEARRQRRSVGELVREAVMIRYGAGGESMRVAAVEELVALNGQVPDDPAQLEAEIIRGAIER